jgi:hypothetical protein
MNTDKPAPKVNDALADRLEAWRLAVKNTPTLKPALLALGDAIVALQSLAEKSEPMHEMINHAVDAEFLDNGNVGGSERGVKWLST